MDEDQLSDADLWDKKVREGMGKEQATQYVLARKGAKSPGAVSVGPMRLETAADVQGRKEAASRPGTGMSAIAGGVSSMPFDDEIGGFISRIFGGDYEASRDHLRAKSQAAIEDHPRAHLAGAIGTGVASGLLGGGVSSQLAKQAPRLAGPAIKAATTTGGRIGQGMLLGGAGGAVGGAGAADGDMGDRIRGGVIGAGVGAAVGGLIPTIGAAGRGILDLTGLRPKAPVSLSQEFAGQMSANPIPTPTQAAGALGVRSIAERADDKLLQNLGRDGTPLDRLQAEALRRASNPKPETIMELGGENVNTLAETVASLPGRGQQTIASALEGRVGARLSRKQPQLARVRADIERLFGLQGGSTQEAAEEIIERRAVAAKPLYDAAMSAEPIADENLARLLNRPSVKSAIEYARRLAGESDIELPDIKAGEPVPIQALHHIKLALDDALYAGRSAARSAAEEKSTGPTMLNAIAKTRAELLKIMDERVPAYREARAIWAGESALKDALEEGQALATRKGFNAEDVKRLVVDMNDGERRMFQQGAVNALLESAGDVSDGRNIAMRVAGNANLRDKLRAIVGSDRALDDFLSDMQRESDIFTKPQRVTGNSATARRLAGQVDIGDAPTPQSVKQVTGTTLVDALTFLPRKGYESAHRRMVEGVAGELGDRLTMGASNPSDIFKLIAALREAEARAAAQAGRSAATTQGAGTVAGITSGRSQRPR